MPEIIWTKLISWHHNNFLVSHFSINKTKDFIGLKYYWPSLRKDVETYIKVYNVYLLFKTVGHKWQSAIIANTDLLTEESFDGFRHKVTNFDQLEKEQW